MYITVKRTKLNITLRITKDKNYADTHFVKFLFYARVILSYCLIDDDLNHDLNVLI